MRARITMIAVAATGLGLIAGPAQAAPMNHFSYPAAEAGSIGCVDHSYTFTGGTFLLSTKATDPNAAPAEHFVANDVTAVDEAGQAYRVVGTESYDDVNGRLVSKLGFVRPGAGQVDSVNVVLHYLPNGKITSFDFGTCGF